MTRPIKIGIATVVVVVTFGVGVVAAPVVRPGLFPASTSEAEVVVGGHPTHTVQPTSVQRAGGSSTTNIHPVPPVSRSTAVEGHSTGDKGSASEETCQDIAKAINEFNFKGLAAYKNGEAAAAKQAFDTVEDLTNAALDNGCFLID
jgi:hypothetical protein